MQQDHTADRVQDAEPDPTADAPVTVPTPSTPVQASHAAADGDAATQLHETTQHAAADGDAEQQDGTEMLPVYAKTAEAVQAGPSAEPTSSDSQLTLL